MSELKTDPPSQATMDELLDPDKLSGNQIKILKKLDEKNLDREDLMEIMGGFLEAYENAKNS